MVLTPFRLRQRHQGFRHSSARIGRGDSGWVVAWSEMPRGMVRTIALTPLKDDLIAKAACAMLDQRSNCGTHIFTLKQGRPYLPNNLICGAPRRRENDNATVCSVGPRIEARSTGQVLGTIARRQGPPARGDNPVTYLGLNLGLKKTGANSQVLWNVVARDGVEPPTPAFSGSKLTVIAST